MYKDIYADRLTTSARAEVVKMLKEAMEVDVICPKMFQESKTFDNSEWWLSSDYLKLGKNSSWDRPRHRPGLKLGNYVNSTAEWGCSEWCRCLDSGSLRYSGIFIGWDPYFTFTRQCSETEHLIHSRKQKFGQRWIALTQALDRFIKQDPSFWNILPYIYIRGCRRTIRPQADRTTTTTPVPGFVCS